MNPFERLRRIAEIIVTVDARCMAADGPVTPTHREITASELQEIYDLAKDTEGAVDDTPAENELDALAALVSRMYDHTWMYSMTQKARWLYDRGMRIRMQAGA